MFRVTVGAIKVIASNMYSCYCMCYQTLSTGSKGKAIVLGRLMTTICQNQQQPEYYSFGTQLQKLLFLTIIEYALCYQIDSSSIAVDS